MSGGNRGGNSATVAGIVAATGIVVALAIAWGVGYLGGRESENRHQTPAAYRQAAKADAERSCVGMQGRALVECVYEKAESGYEQAYSEQDLTAQQRAAGAALIAAIMGFFTVIVSGVGIYFIRRTLEHAQQTAQIELRAYMAIDSPTLKRDEASDTEQHLWYEAVIKFKNYGATPAKRFRFRMESLLVKGDPPDYGDITDSEWDIAGSIAQGDDVNVPFPFFVSRKHQARFELGRLTLFLVYEFAYEDVFGKEYREFAVLETDKSLKWGMSGESGYHPEIEEDQLNLL